MRQLTWPLKVLADEVNHGKPVIKHRLSTHKKRLFNNIHNWPSLRNSLRRGGSFFGTDWCTRNLNWFRHSCPGGVHSRMWRHTMGNKHFNWPLKIQSISLVKNTKSKSNWYIPLVTMRLLVKITGGKSHWSIPLSKMRLLVNLTQTHEIIITGLLLLISRNKVKRSKMRVCLVDLFAPIIFLFLFLISSH